MRNVDSSFPERSAKSHDPDLAGLYPAIQCANQTEERPGRVDETFGKVSRNGERLFLFPLWPSRSDRLAMRPSAGEGRIFFPAPPHRNVGRESPLLECFQTSNPLCCDMADQPQFSGNRKKTRYAPACDNIPFSRRVPPTYLLPIVYYDAVKMTVRFSRPA